MRYLPIIMLFLFTLPTVLAVSETWCQDNQTLLINSTSTIKINDNTTELVVTEEKDCQYGCVNDKCQDPLIMMSFPIYLFLAGANILFIILAFFKRDILIFAWFPVLISAVLGVTSYDVGNIYCEHGSSWDCQVVRYGSVPLMWFWYGVTLLMLVYAMVISIWQPAETAAKQEREPYY